jgi:glycogen debranching enzyme
VLWLGDFEWAARSLTSLFRFQSRSAVSILGGEPGELPMQVSPGPIFLYGTSDSTLRFPPVVDQLLRHTGDRTTVESWSSAVERIVEWAQERTDATTALLRHGGEAEAIAATTSQLARVRYGIDSPDTTIWDSADRRDHAIDVQVLWWETMDAVERIARLSPGNRTDAPPLDNLKNRLAATIRGRYAWPAEGYLYDSLRNGVPTAQLRPNALRAVSAGLLEPNHGAAVLQRAMAEDMSTPWGVRTLSSRDPTYDPRAYHGGQVWTIATAWAADAAFAVGDVPSALRYVRTIAARYAAEGGFANECYRGDRAEGWNSCFLLGFSIAPFLTLLFERLWGIRVDGLAGNLRVVPAFPPEWRSASLTGLRVGHGRLDLDWTPERLRARWSGLEALSLDAGAGPFDVPARGTVEIPLARVGQA